MAHPTRIGPQVDEAYVGKICEDLLDLTQRVATTPGEICLERFLDLARRATMNGDAWYTLVRVIAWYDRHTQPIPRDPEDDDPVHVHRPQEGRKSGPACVVCQKALVWSVFDNAWMTEAEWGAVERARKRAGERQATRGDGDRAKVEL